MRVIIMPPVMDWDWMRQRPQQLMKQLARLGFTVFYCNRSQLGGALEEQAADGIYIVHDHEAWLRERWPVFRRVHKPEQIVLWCAIPTLVHSLKRYGPCTVIYDCADHIPEWDKAEKLMLETAERVVCSSSRLADKLSRDVPGSSLELIRNAYDEDMGLHADWKEGTSETSSFADSESTRIVGFIGAWAPWIDEGLLERIVRLIPRIKIVVIGAEFMRKFTINRPNIHFLGHQPHTALPNYIRQMDVCLIPFRLTPITLAANPIKAYEYLAAGKPVIAADMPECRLMHPFVDTARSRSDFVDLIRLRLETPGEQGPRREYALRNTWHHRAMQARRMLDAMLP